jgi:hypothetical protein
MNTDYKKDFVPHEPSLALKELGFDEPCLGYWKSKNWLIQEKTRTDGYTHADQECSAPLYQQAFRWFRDKYQLHCTITSISQESWQWHITKPGESLGKLYDEDFYTYEEAELACLIKLIEIVKFGNYGRK